MWFKYSKIGRVGSIQFSSFQTNLWPFFFTFQINEWLSPQNKSWKPIELQYRYYFFSTVVVNTIADLVLTWPGYPALCQMQIGRFIFPFSSHPTLWSRYDCYPRLQLRRLVVGNVMKVAKIHMAYWTQKIGEGAWAQARDLKHRAVMLLLKTNRQTMLCLCEYVCVCACMCLCVEGRDPSGYSLEGTALGLHGWGFQPGPVRMTCLLPSRCPLSIAPSPTPPTLLAPTAQQFPVILSFPHQLQLAPRILRLVMHCSKFQNHYPSKGSLKHSNRPCENIPSVSQGVDQE